MSGHAPHEQVEHAQHGASNQSVALVISCLALLLAVSEIFGQKAQTTTLQSNIEASNLWSFYQAKTIRKTIQETAAEEFDVLAAGTKDEPQKKAMLDRVAKWKAAAARYESEPGKPILDPKTGKETGELAPGEGRKELIERAKVAEAKRDKYGNKHFRFELATGSFQIGIVLASAAIVTSIGALLWGAGALGIMGLVLLATGIFL
jgi:Domain of unknown function (DUF4337)